MDVHIHEISRICDGWSCVDENFMDKNFMDEKLDFHGIKVSSKRLWLLEGKSRGVMAFNIEPDIIPLHTLLEQK